METKKIGIFTGISTAVGVALGSTAFVSLGNGAGSGGIWFIYAILIVGFIYICFAMSACELNDILPGCKGNAGRLLERAFGPSVSIVLNITTYFIISVVAGSAETIFVSRAVHNTLLPNESDPIKENLKSSSVVTGFNLFSDSKYLEFILDVSTSS